MKGERTWHIETFRARWPPLCSTRQEQHLRQHVPISTADNRWQKKTVATVPAVLHSFLKNGYRHVAYQLILGASWQAHFFVLCRPIIAIFFMDHNEFYLNVLLPLILSLTFMLHFLRGQTRAIQVQIHCQYACCAGAACPWQPAQPNPPESGFHTYHTFCNIPPPISHLVAISHLFVALSHNLFGISLKICII